MREDSEYKLRVDVDEQKAKNDADMKSHGGDTTDDALTSDAHASLLNLTAISELLLDEKYMVYAFKLSGQLAPVLNVQGTNVTRNKEWSSVCGRTFSPLSFHNNVAQVAGRCTPSSGAKSDMRQCRNDKGSGMQRRLRAGELGECVSGDVAMALMYVDKHRGGQQRAFRNEAAFVSALFQLNGEGKCEATIANGNAGGWGGSARGPGGDPLEVGGAVGLLVVLKQ
jgi:hypothetical protein